MIQYPNLDLYFTEIFPLIYKYLASEIDPIPKYEDQKLGMEQLRGILERIQTKHYSTFYEKAAYLYLGIIKGHYFSNGNKRLAVLSFAFFYEMNAYKLKNILIGTDRIFNINKDLTIPKFNDEFLQFLYKFSIILVQINNTEFDELKRGVTEVFKDILVK